MTENTLKRFTGELNSFFVLVLLNLVFGAMAMASGMQYMVSSVLGTARLLNTGMSWVYEAAIAMVCFGLGLGWMVSSTRILKGITRVRREYRQQTGPVPPEKLTCWIVRLLGHYRGNRARIHWMVFICILGGCAFLILGIANLVQGIMAGAGTGIFPILAAGINLTIGCASLASAMFFRRYSAVWDKRILNAAETEYALQQAMEQR